MPCFVADVMLIPGWLVLPLLMIWTQLSLQMSKAATSGEVREIYNPDYKIFHPNTGHTEWNNGALSLVLSELTEQVIGEMTSESEAEVRLTHLQAKRLRHKLKDFYSILKDHPALQEPHLFVGPTKPEVVRDTALLTVRRSKFSSSPLSSSVNIAGLSQKYAKAGKRAEDGFALDIEQPVCPSRAEWKLLKHAKDINDSRVEVYQPAFGSDGMQWFYIVSCVNRAFNWQRDCPGCCIGINHRSYASTCKPKKTFVMAYIRRPPEKKHEWNWIQVDTSCNCAVKPLNPFDLA